MIVIANEMYFLIRVDNEVLQIIPVLLEYKSNRLDEELIKHR
jgi:hypothetical protein